MSVKDMSIFVLKMIQLIAEDITDYFDHYFDAREDHKLLCLLVICPRWTVFPYRFMVGS